MTTIKQAIDSFLENVRKSQPRNTYKNYKSDLVGSSGFLTLLSIKSSTPAAKLSEDMAAQYLQILLDNGAAAATRQRKAAAVREFYRFVIAMDLADITIEKLNFKIKSGKLLRGKKKYIEFPKDKIDRILDHVESIKPSIYPPEVQLEIKRNKAFIFTLAETGLRVGSTCALRMSDIDIQGRSALIVGKGDSQTVVYFGKKSWRMLADYLKQRGITEDMDVPLFTRHDKNAPKTPKPITEETAEKIVHAYAQDALGKDYDQKITAHKFRHYFVTNVLDKTGDLKKAQDLANHKSISTTANYAHRSNKQNRDTHASIYGVD